MAHQELGHRVLQKALSLLGEKAGVEREPKFEGRKLSMIVGKTKGKEKGKAETVKGEEIKLTP